MALSLESFTNQRVIYRHEDKVEVFKAFSTYHGRQVCVKVLPISSPDDINSVLQETLVQSALSHPNVCQIYDCFVTGSMAGLKAVVVMEEMEKDLLTEIQERRAAKSFWKEEQLWRMFKVLVETFAFLRSKDISHRDVKPNNILVGVDGTLKVCDFGTSKRFYLPQAMHTIKGTQTFMSPACKAALQRDQIEVSHDPFKSDVYSLGLTFLSMARLVPPFEMQVSGEKLPQAIVRTMAKVLYSGEIKDLMQSMLQPEEALRPDFDELRLRFTLMPALKQLNDYFKPEIQETDLAAALKVALDARISTTISKIVQCSRCQQDMDLGGQAKDQVFCDCGTHSYCSVACYTQQEHCAVSSSLKAHCSQPKTASCLLCASVIVRRGKDEVRLDCDPENHMFCDFSCLNRFIQERSLAKYSSGDQIKCPKCDLKINESILCDLYQSKEQYFKVIKRQCMKCHRKKFRLLTKCGHTYCKPCCEEIKANMKAMGISQLVCYICNGRIEKNEIKKALSSVKHRLRSFLSFITT